jgi:hypothetical protein
MRSVLLELVVGHDAVDVAEALGERGVISSATSSASLERDAGLVMRHWSTGRW